MKEKAFKKIATFERIKKIQRGGVFKHGYIIYETVDVYFNKITGDEKEIVVGERLVL